MDLLAVVFQPKEQKYLLEFSRLFCKCHIDFKLKLYMWKFYCLIVVLPEISSTLLHHHEGEQGLKSCTTKHSF